MGWSSSAWWWSPPAVSAAHELHPMPITVKVEGPCPAQLGMRIGAARRAWRREVGRKAPAEWKQRRETGPRETGRRVPEPEPAESKEREETTRTTCGAAPRAHARARRVSRAPKEALQESRAMQASAAPPSGPGQRPVLVARLREPAGRSAGSRGLRGLRGLREVRLGERRAPLGRSRALARWRLRLAGRQARAVRQAPVLVRQVGRARLATGKTTMVTVRSTRSSARLLVVWARAGGRSPRARTACSACASPARP
jgi:hypothetical protein